MRQTLWLFLVAVTAAVHGTTVTMDELLCATNISVNSVNIPDESAFHPLVTMASQVQSFAFGLTGARAAQVFVNIVKSSVSFTPYDELDDVTGSVLLLADVVSAVTFQPGAYPGCVDTPGCDGIQFNAIAFRKLFPTNTTYVLFSCRLQYTSNGSITTAGSPFQTLSVMQLFAGTTVLGTTGLITTNITFASTITPASGAAASTSFDLTSAGAIVMWVVIAIVATIVLICGGRCLWSHPMAGGDRPQKLNGGEYGDAIKTGGSYYSAHYGGRTGEAHHRIHAATRVGISL